MNFFAGIVGLLADAYAAAHTTTYTIDDLVQRETYYTIPKEMVGDLMDEHHLRLTERQSLKYPSLYLVILDNALAAGRPKLTEYLCKRATKEELQLPFAYCCVPFKTCLEASIEKANQMNENIRILLKHGVNPNLYIGTNTLALAAKKHNYEALALMAEHGATISKTDPSTCGVIHGLWQAHRQNFVCLKLVCNSLPRDLLKTIQRLFLIKIAPHLISNDPPEKLEAVKLKLYKKYLQNGYPVSPPL